MMKHIGHGFRMRLTPFEPCRASVSPFSEAFHGSRDFVNPWKGDGDDYWKQSVPEAMQHWAKFNKCRPSGLFGFS